MFFELYDEDKDGVLNSTDIINMSKELYWILSVIKEKNIAWDAVTTLIVNSCEQSDVARGAQPDEKTLTHRLADLAMSSDSMSFKQRIKQLEDSMIADVIDITLPSFRMVVLTIESLEMFFDHGFSKSFSFVKSATDRQRSFGREVFENLFADGQQLAAETPKQTHLQTTPSMTPSTSTQTLSQGENSSPNMSGEVDDLIHELGHFDV